jgi:hypothetical protein
MVDALARLPAKVSTHTDGHAYDRILVSDAIENGRAKLKLDRVEIYPHRHGRGEERRAYTDHFPVVAWLKVEGRK